MCANLHLLEELSKKKELFLQLNNYQKNGMKRINTLTRVLKVKVPVSMANITNSKARKNYHAESRDDSHTNIAN